MADIASLEHRAADAEARLAALESKLASGGGAALNANAYISQLEALKEIMLAAKSEHTVLQQKVAELETSNSKLAYQVKHLKRALQESDEKLAAK